MLLFKQNKADRRIAKQLIFSLILASAFITLIITGYQLYRDYSYDIGEINNRFVQIEQVYLSPLSHALWTTDKKEMQLQIDGMRRLPDMQYIAVYENDKLLVSSGTPKQQNIIKSQFELTYKYRGVVRKIGRLEIIATLNNIYKRLFDRFWVILVSNAIKTLIIASFLMYIFQLLVTRHIRHLADQVSEIDTDDLEKPIKLNRPKSRDDGGDEFDVLLNAFAGMQKKIAEGFDNVKRREEELRLYEMILETTKEQMSYIDRNYIYRSVNLAYTTLHGVTREQIIGRSVQDLLGKELFYNVSKPNLDKVFKGEQLQCQTLLTTRRGNQIELEINYYPYYGDSDEVQGAVINARDISDRARMEQERLRNAQVYAALAQQGASQYRDFLCTSLTLLKEVFQFKYALVGKLIDGTLQVKTECVLSGDQVLEDFMYDLAGTPCEAVYKNDKTFIYRDAPILYSSDKILLEMEAQCYFGISLIDTKGKIRGILAVLDVMPHDYEVWHEDVLSVFAARIAVEMERAEALSQLERYNEELEEQIAIRTSDLQNSIKELETFSYSVSHDLRTPLRTINGYSQILMDDYKSVLDEGGIAYLAKIRKSSEKMSALIDSLLRLSRISRHNIELEYVDFSKLCEGIIKGYREITTNENLHFKLQSGMIAYCDSKLMRIALENLIDNAIKYSSKQSKPEIEIGIHPEDDGYVFYIRDNGVGFDTKYTDLVFQPFQRLHSGEFSGTGIGLATVQRIIHRHGGKIWADSTPQQGTVFSFILPGSYLREAEQLSSVS